MSLPDAPNTLREKYYSVMVGQNSADILPDIETAPSTENRYLDYMAKHGGGGGGGDVSGVKGDAEETYRTGNVNITAANVGAYTKTETNTLLNSKADTTDVNNVKISNTATGTSITLTDSADGYVQGVTVKGHSEVVDGAIKSVGDAGWGVVDLGTLTWEEFQAGTQRWFSNALANLLSYGTRLTPLYCQIYDTIDDGTYDLSRDKVIYTSANPDAYIFVQDHAFTDATAFKSAMSGVLLYYPLADTTGATPIFGITSKNGAGQGTAATITTGLPLCSTLDGTVYDELTNEKVITRCEVVDDEVVPLATPIETPLTSAEKSALASLRTYNHTTYIDATDAPTMTVDYLLNTDNGKAVADIQKDLQEQIDSGSFAETVLYDNMNLTVEPAANLQLNLSQSYTNFDEIKIEYAYYSTAAAANNTIYPYEYSYSVAELEAMRTSLYNGRKGYLLLDRYLNFANMYISMDITSTSVLTINDVKKSSSSYKHYITKITGIKY